MRHDLVREQADARYSGASQEDLDSQPVLLPVRQSTAVPMAAQARAWAGKIAQYLFLALFLVILGMAVGVDLTSRPPEISIPFLGLLPTILRGLTITITLTAFGAALALVIAILVGIARNSRIWLVRNASGLYVEFFRGTSVLVQMFWIYFVLPNPPFNLRLTALQAGILALGLNLGAYGAEVVRGALQAVPREQFEATIALNMSPGLRLRHVVLPQAMVRILPPFGNLLIELLKCTSLASLITLADVTFQGRLLIQSIGRMGEVFTLLLIVYFLLAYPLVLGVRWIERQRRWV